MSPALNRTSALQRFECSNAVEICNETMFDFYPGLPHMAVGKAVKCIVDTQTTGEDPVAMVL